MLNIFSDSNIKEQESAEMDLVWIKFWTALSLSLFLSLPFIFMLSWSQMVEAEK